MRIVLAQINSVVGDLAGNARHISSCVEAAARADADLVVFPELAVSGYPPEDLLLKRHFVRRCYHSLLEIATACLDIVAVVGVPLQDGEVVFNAAAVLAGGRVQAVHRKIWLPNYAVFDEKRYFAEGRDVLVLRLPRGRVGVNVCEDIWHAAGPSEEAVLSGGAQMVVNISMSPYHVGKVGGREAMLSERAVDCGAWIVYLNGVGGQDELVFDGHSAVVSPHGVVVARAPQFEEALLVHDLPLDAPRPAPAAGLAPGFWPVNEVQITGPTYCPNCMGTAPAGALRVRSVDLEPRLAEEEEVYRALVLGVRDYVEKNGFARVVIGLSGGIDSALVAAIAVDALGPARVVGVSMPSRYSSTATQDDARMLAENLGIEFHEIAIEAVFAAYLSALESVLEGREPDATEENIQARIRGNYLMALSNKFGYLVLTTGNKSEVAVGYATLYGDMAGGFAAVKDVPKTMVYALSRYRNRVGSGDGPIPPSTIERPPSAELRHGQLDQDYLPPYDLLDRIIEAYVVRDESVEEMVEAGLDRKEVERVVAMVDGNEYKRRQAAPGVRITPKAFGKDRRLPITNRFRG
jgi:NAD+ synthase (glutamine-hydrolysing)